MPAFRIEGTVLAKRPYGESDAAVDVFTVTRGLETFAAKGAFRSRRRLVGGLEPFTRTEFVIYQSRPGKWPVVQDLKVLTPRFELYRDLETFTRLTDVSVFLIHHLPPGVPEYEVHDLFEDFLTAALSAGRVESLVLSFYLRAFCALGWKLDVGACAVCRRLPQVDGEYRLDFSSGRMVCPVCTDPVRTASRVDPDRDPPAVRLTLDQARGLSALVIPLRLKAGIQIDASVEPVLRRIIDRYLLWHTGVDLSRDASASRAV